jgi:hypothetical protein
MSGKLKECLGGSDTDLASASQKTTDSTNFAAETSHHSHTVNVSMLDTSNEDRDRQVARSARLW